MKRFWIFLAFLALVPFALLCYLPMALTNGDSHQALWAELWAGVFIALWIALGIMGTITLSYWRK